jgi:hypothetical protein
MKKFVISISLMMIAGVAFAQQKSGSNKTWQLTHKVICDTPEKMFHRYMEFLAQRPIFLANASPTLSLSKKIPAGGIIVLYNKNKDRFSIFQFNENAACLLAQGNTVEFGNEVDFDPEILNQIREQK